MTGLYISLDDYIVDPLDEILAAIEPVEEEFLYYPSKMNEKKEPATRLKVL